MCLFHPKGRERQQEPFEQGKASSQEGYCFRDQTHHKKKIKLNPNPRYRFVGRRKATEQAQGGKTGERERAAPAAGTTSGKRRTKLRKTPGKARDTSTTRNRWSKMIGRSLHIMPGAVGKCSLLT